MVSGKVAPPGAGGGMFLFGPLAVPFGGGQKKKSTAGAAGARKVLVTFNVMFMILSLGLLGVGILFRLGNAIIIDPLTSILDKPSLEAKAVGLEGVDFDKFDLAPLLGSVSTYLIAMGLCGVFLALLGIVSVKMKKLVVTLIYSMLLGTLLFLQIGVIVITCVSRRWVDGIVKPSLVSSISRGYHGYNATDATSLAWNIVMLTFSCCGVDDYLDFHSSRQWNRMLYQDDRWFRLATPVLCCKIANLRPGDLSCAINPSDFNSNYEYGCYTAVIDALSNFQIYVLFGLIVLAAIQIAMLVSSVVLTKDAHAHQKDKDKKYNSKRADRNTDNKDGSGRGKKHNNLNRSNMSSEENHRCQLNTLSSSRPDLWRNLHGGNNMFRCPATSTHIDSDRRDGNSLHDLLQGLATIGMTRPQSQDGVSALLSVLRSFPGIPGTMVDQRNRNPQMQNDSGFDPPPIVYKSGIPSGIPDLHTMSGGGSTFDPSVYVQNNALVPTIAFPRRESFDPMIYQPPIAISNTSRLPYNSNEHGYGPLIEELAENKMDPLLRRNTVSRLLHNFGNPSSPNQVRIRKDKPPLLRCNSVA